MPRSGCACAHPDLRLAAKWWNNGIRRDILTNQNVFQNVTAHADYCLPCSHVIYDENVPFEMSLNTLLNEWMGQSLGK